MSKRPIRRLTVNKFERQRRQMGGKVRKSKSVFPNDSVSNLARGLKNDEWEKLAYSLGFLAQVGEYFLS